MKIEKLTVRGLLDFVNEHNLDNDYEIKVNGCEIQHINAVKNNKTIYLDECYDFSSEE